MPRLLHACIALVVLAAQTTILADEPTGWDWAFPSAPVPTGSGDIPLRVPGSRLAFTSTRIHDPRRAVDWFPGRHPPMPRAVEFGRTFACAYCHQPSGSGRPENSALAGLPADYIARQVRAFADGSRKSAVPAHRPGETMTMIAKTTSGQDVAEAADYFASLRFASHVRVVETHVVPGVTREAFVYRVDGGPSQPLGARIIETPDDFERFERRDPEVRYTAYVPRGSVAAGRRLAASGGPAGQPCTSCHGAGLRGGIAPPLAGRSPTMLFRQLAAFRAGTRANAEAEPMRSIAAKLGTPEMIALAAYAATQRP